MDILKDYTDKCFIASVLCELSYNWYSNIYNLSLLPTILGSSILTILNSAELPHDTMKKTNIIINGLNAVVLSLVNSYKISDRVNNFKNCKIKFVKLNHIIESLIIKNSDIDKSLLESLINDYDKLWDEINYQFPVHIRTKVINKYGQSHKLPNSLDIDNQLNKKNTINNNTELVIINDKP